MDQIRHIKIALYNIDREPGSTPSDDTFIQINANANQAQAFQIIKKREIAHTFEDLTENEDQVKITINPVEGLSRGQLLIDAPELLNEKAWCIQLPRNRALNGGLIVVIHKPGGVGATTLQYHAPTTTTKGIIQIAMPPKRQFEKIGIITWEIGTAKKPILTEIENGDPQSHLITIVRMLAYEGAYSQPQNGTMTVTIPQDSSDTVANPSDRVVTKQEN